MGMEMFFYLLTNYNLQRFFKLFSWKYNFSLFFFQYSYLMHVFDMEFLVLLFSSKFIWSSDHEVTFVVRLKKESYSNCGIQKRVLICECVNEGAWLLLMIAPQLPLGDYS